MLPEKRYTKTKPSGVEWLGEIPEGWEVIKIKYIAELNPKKSTLEDIDQECSFIPMEKLKLGKITLDETRKIEDVYDGYTYFIDNDLLIAKVTPCFENKNFAIAENLKNGIGFGSSEIYVLRNNGKSLSKFLFYRLQENKFMDLATYSMSGAGGLKRIPSDFLNNYKIALPPLPEQTAIADYLDRKTAYIDCLISKQQTLLDKLSEQRTALITAVVTGKIDTNGKHTSYLKDSGVEWLGEIPEGWEAKRLKFVGKLQGGTGFPHDYQNIQDFPISFYKVGDLGLSENSIDMPKAQHTIDESIAELLGAKIIRDKSILYAKVGAALLLNRRRITNSICCIDNNMTAFIPNLEEVTEKWAFYFLSIIDFGNFVNPGAVPSLSEGYQSNFPFLVPSLEEQTAIADYLDRETAKIDRLREKIEQSIDKLKEYRSTLITKVVTGKIKIIEEQS